jgi:long-chain acyl-CoA synthetase
MCFLPLTHIFEKAWTYYCLHRGVTVAINRDPTEIRAILPQVRPTLMSNVPRFWEKVYDGVREKIDSASGIAKWLFNDAVKCGRRHNLEYVNEGKRPPLGNSIKFFLYRHTIFYAIKKIVGIDRGNFFPVAGAPLSDNINEFMQSIDVHIIYGYGLSETTATVSCFLQKGFTLGTVGTVMPEVEVKIGDNNEILVKSATVMSGYYNKPEQTAAVFTEDGWFRTGDAGYLNENNEIILTERIKDLYKTSNGKYIAPQMIETRIGEDKYIDQVAVIGDERKFVSALIVPNYDALKTYAGKQNIAYNSIEELIESSEIHDFISGRIELLQAQFTSYEKIKRFALLPQPFSMANGELTNTLKLRRKVISEKYAGVIDALYAE